jgi:hypothetical protein
VDYKISPYKQQATRIDWTLSLEKDHAILHDETGNVLGKWSWFAAADAFTMPSFWLNQKRFAINIASIGLTEFDLSATVLNEIYRWHRVAYVMKYPNAYLKSLRIGLGFFVCGLGSFCFGISPILVSYFEAEDPNATEVDIMLKPTIVGVIFFIGSLKQFRTAIDWYDLHCLIAEEQNTN